jgi:hypothetical protein
MTTDIEDVLRQELRGAAGDAPRRLGVDDPVLLARGHRVVRRRRVLAVAGASAAALAAAGAVTLAAPGPDQGTLPAGPGPTSTSAPQPSPSSTPSTTPSTDAGWSAPVVVGGRTYRARLAADGDNADVVVQADGAQVAERVGIYDSEGSFHLDSSDRAFVHYIGSWPIVDVVTIQGTPVEDEQIRTIRLAGVGADPSGNRRPDIHVSVVRTGTPTSSLTDGKPQGWVVRVGDGSTWDVGAS